MDFQIRWTDKAAEDLDQAADHIARDSLQNAIAFYHGARRKAMTLSLFPQAGHVVQEFPELELREIPFQSHRIIYRIEGREVLITGLIHGARQLSQVESRFRPRPDESATS